VYKTNIVLTGMPGSGKTTIGRLLAKKLGMGFADTDAIVEEKHGAIPEIFSREGEAAFRKYEREAAVKAAAMRDTVISTGGGIILGKSNMDALGASGTVVFLDRPLETLLSETDTSGRPLLAGGKEAIAALFEQRHGLYTSCAEIIQQNASDALSCVSDIIKKLEEM
jgi:shikimate kinase